MNRGSEIDAFNTCEDIRQRGVRALPVLCDVRDEASVQTAVAKTIEEFGKLDLLVNNAGAFETVALEEITLAEWRRVMTINLDSMFLTTKAFVPGTIMTFPGLKDAGERADVIAYLETLK